MGALRCRACFSLHCTAPKCSAQNCNAWHYTASRMGLKGGPHTPCPQWLSALPTTTVTPHGSLSGLYMPEMACQPVLPIASNRFPDR